MSDKTRILVQCTEDLSSQEWEVIGSCLANFMKQSAGPSVVQYEYRYTDSQIESCKLRMIRVNNEQVVVEKLERMEAVYLH